MAHDVLAHDKLAHDKLAHDKLAPDNREVPFFLLSALGGFESGGKGFFKWGLKSKEILKGKKNPVVQQNFDS